MQIIVVRATVADVLVGMAVFYVEKQTGVVKEAVLTGLFATMMREEKQRTKPVIIDMPVDEQAA